jgi:hypothetical protein
MSEKKILAVDADAGSLDKISRLLEVHKYRVARAAAGPPPRPGTADRPEKDITHDKSLDPL